MQKNASDYLFEELKLVQEVINRMNWVPHVLVSKAAEPRPAYLEPNSQSMQKPVEGVYSLKLLSELYAVSFYKGYSRFRAYQFSSFTAVNSNRKSF